MNAPPLPKLIESRPYERAVTAWNGPRITIISPANKPIAHIPLNFFIRGGDSTRAYMIEVVRQLVVENDGWIFDGVQAVSPADSPCAGTFVYSSQGKPVSHPSVQLRLTQKALVCCTTYSWVETLCTSLLDLVTLRPTSQLRLMVAKVVTAHERRLRMLK